MQEKYKEWWETPQRFEIQEIFNKEAYPSVKGSYQIIKIPKGRRVTSPRKIRLAERKNQKA